MLLLRCGCGSDWCSIGFLALLATDLDDSGFLALPLGHDLLYLSISHLLEHIFFSHLVNDLLLLFLNYLFSLNESDLPPEELAVLHESVASLDLLKVGVGSVGECLLLCGDSLLLKLLGVDQSLLFASNALCILDLVLLNLILIPVLEVLLSGDILEVEDFLEVSLEQRDVIVELGELVLDVVPLVLVVVELLPERLDLELLGLETRLERVDQLGDLVALPVQHVQLRPHLLHLLRTRDRLLQLLDVVYQPLLLLQSHRGRLITLLQLVDLSLDLNRVLQILVGGECLEYLFAFEFDDLDLLNDSVLLVVEVPLLIAQSPDLFDLLVEELLVADGGALDLAALSRLLLLEREVVDVVANLQDLTVEVLHLLLVLVLAGLLLAETLLDNRRHLGLRSHHDLLEFGSRPVEELVDPRVRVQVLLRRTLSVLMMVVLLALLMLIIVVTGCALLATLVVGLRTASLQVAARSLGSAALNLVVVAATASAMSPAPASVGLDLLLARVDVLLLVLLLPLGSSLLLLLTHIKY